MNKYTFLVPAYKPNYLKAALASIFAQIYNDFKVVVSDDCSPYNLHEVVAPFIEKYGDDKIIYRRNKKNIGGERLVDHWNLLLDQCDSEYAIMASDDDLYSPIFLEVVDGLSNKYPQVDVIRTRIQRINEKDEVSAKEDIFEEYQSRLEAIFSIFCGRYLGCIGNYVFHTKVLKSKGGFVNLPYAWFSDLLTVVSLLENGQANSNDILFNFRLSGINISDTTKNKKVDEEKLRATIGYDKYMSEVVSQWVAPKSLYEKIMQEGIISAFKHRAYSQVGDYSWAIPIFQWKKIYDSMKELPYFSKGSFLKYFGESVFNRWFAKFSQNG